MQSKKIVVALIALVVLGGGWYAFRPERLFVNQKVSESLPATGGASAASASSMEAEPQALASGRFHTNAHETAGMATIYRLPNGSRVLRLTDFHTSNGPDVHVYLVAAGDVTEDGIVKQAGFVDLGSIKGNIGDQNYEVASDVDLAKYRSVTIWCARFNVNFGTAPLMTADRGEAMPAMSGGAPRAERRGTFHTNAHHTSGTAAVYALGEGQRVLRLTGFETSNGPDVHVYLVAADDVNDNDTVKSAGYVDLGSLKGNIGDQNYDIPATVDLAKYRAVTIWCARFGVNFGTAPLANPAS